jgi:uncharacterized protein YdhG (YjbR/CyaY superfamily)
VAEVDYRALLQKYMRKVYEDEGTTCVYNVSTASVQFTLDEEVELQLVHARVEAEIEEECS